MQTKQEQVQSLETYLTFSLLMFNWYFEFTHIYQDTLCKATKYYAAFLVPL